MIVSVVGLMIQTLTVITANEFSNAFILMDICWNLVHLNIYSEPMRDLQRYNMIRVEVGSMTS